MLMGNIRAFPSMDSCPVIEMGGGEKEEEDLQL